MGGWVLKPKPGVLLPYCIGKGVGFKPPTPIPELYEGWWGEETEKVEIFQQPALSF